MLLLVGYQHGHFEIVHLFFYQTITIWLIDKWRNWSFKPPIPRQPFFVNKTGRNGAVKAVPHLKTRTLRHHTRRIGLYTTAPCPKIFNSTQSERQARQNNLSDMRNICHSLVANKLSILMKPGGPGAERAPRSVFSTDSVPRSHSRTHFYCPSDSISYLLVCSSPLSLSLFPSCCSDSPRSFSDPCFHRPKRFC